MKQSINPIKLPGIYHVVGSDGAGKSTIIKLLKESYPNAIYIKEPFNPEIIDQINHTQSIHDRIDLFARDRYLLYKSLDFTKPTPIISDRSFICSLVYQSLELELNRWSPFTAIKHIYQAQLNLIPPTKVIYIHANPRIIYNRLQHRDVSHHLTIDQIVHIQARYNYIFNLFNISVVPIDTSYISPNINVNKIISYI